MISLIIADDHPIYLEGPEMLLNREKEYKIAARCHLGVEAIATLKTTNCDVAFRPSHAGYEWP
jgi:DNA-binding NarL/FixJ family response regulator